VLEVLSPFWGLAERRQSPHTSGLLAYSNILSGCLRLPRAQPPGPPSLPCWHPPAPGGGRLGGGPGAPGQAAAPRRPSSAASVGGDAGPPSSCTRRVKSAPAVRLPRA